MSKKELCNLKISELMDSWKKHKNLPLYHDEQEIELNAYEIERKLKEWTIAVVKEMKKEKTRPKITEKSYWYRVCVIKFLIDKFELTEDDLHGQRGRLRLMIYSKTPPKWKFWKRGLRKN